MLSFRAMRMVMDGNRTDTARVPADGVLVGYPVTPLRMPMDMYMVGAMYAPTDRLTLVSMVPVLDISMDHRRERAWSSRPSPAESATSRCRHWLAWPRARVSGRTCTWA